MMPSVVGYPSFHRSVQRLHPNYTQVSICLTLTSLVIGTHIRPGLVVVSVVGDRQPTVIRA
jgi:hypothetical protein